MRPLIRTLLKKKNFDLGIIVSGGILIEQSQKTLNDIKTDGIDIVAKLPVDTANENHAYTIGELCLKILPEIKKYSPDLSIVYADRYEAFSFAIAVSHSDIPLLHLESGDITEGGTHDDQVRHCISKLSHLFCCSTLKGCEVISRLGEESWRCIHSGLISYDDMRFISEINRRKVLEKFSIEEEVILLATMHPIPKNLELTKIESIEFFEALKLIAKLKNIKIFITAPNNDQGTKIISCLIKKYISKIENAIYVESFGGKLYHSMMSLAKDKNLIVCGNSSSIIKEAPFYGAHSLNIGSRQRGRESASTQTNTEAERKLIFDQLKILFNKKCQKGSNPYYKENSSETIIKFIEDVFKKYSKEEILLKKWNR